MPATPAPAADAVAALVAQAEMEYQAGLASYKAGDATAAKQHFDNAFNTLLDSKLDIRSDDRLQEEFDRMVEGVDQLDLGGGGNDSEAQKSEPAPIDETNGITPAADANVIAKAQAEVKHTHSDLPLMMTDQVAGYISYFSNRGRGTFERAFARSGRYREMMLPILKKEGIPQDLIYLAQAESGFHPLAVSRVGARGIWQFMASRARGYGLSHNMWVDDRQDPVKSTWAAARHLKDLYNQFGDWYLAMAAYNSGPGTVQAAVRRTGYADFWELYRRNVLPKETRNYVPIILAVTIMAKNPSQYGLDDVNMDDPIAYDTVTVSYPVDLRLVAESVDSTPEEIQDLNPSLLRLATPREGTFELHLPKGTKDEYETAIASIPQDMRLWWRYHKVESGDTLTSLAHAYRTTAKSIEEINHLDAGDALPAEAKLIIPVAPGRHPLTDGGTYARRITRYRVRRGDTVETVAENFGVPATMLRRWNGLHGNSLRGRRVLALHLPITPSSHDIEIASRTGGSKRAEIKRSASKSSTARNDTTLRKTFDQVSVVHHKVKSGETLYSIATAYKTTVEALKRDNRNVAILRPGMILIVQQSR
ncbi:MAG TPA: LysM peptidoglycan-binding domain-containing protein [Candidatus Aquilonibacter sp.]|nr:LysM peptidoglycan-binding domain-containing protein [Candidatus Aquilonibacter sp.]